MIKIVTDCAAELTNEEAAELGVTVAPLYIHFPEGQVSALDISADDFYDRLRKMEPDIPTTAQPSSEEFAIFYKKVLEPGDEILSIHISSGLSGTINSARLGAEQLADKVVQIFDTMTLSGGERFHVLAAVHGLRAGWSRAKIVERLEQIRAKTEIIYTLETLTYLARGGRIGRVQALAGLVLHIKPVIRVDHADGKYSTVGKTRTISQSLDLIVSDLKGRFGDTPLWATVLHGQFAEQAKVLADKLGEKLNIAYIETMRISPVLGVHTGPGIVGVGAVPMALMQGIE